MMGMHATDFMAVTLGELHDRRVDSVRFGARAPTPEATAMLTRTPLGGLSAARCLAYRDGGSTPAIVEACGDDAATAAEISRLVDDHASFQPATRRAAAVAVIEELLRDGDRATLVRVASFIADLTGERDR